MIVLVPPSPPVPLPHLDEDINGNAKVEAGDYTLWANNFGMIIGADWPQAVPEPSTVTLAGLGLGGLLAHGRRRRGPA